MFFYRSSIIVYKTYDGEEDPVCISTAKGLTLSDISKWYLLALPPEWQRNFSNADLSVVHPSSVFISLKSLISQKNCSLNISLFMHVASPVR